MALQRKMIEVQHLTKDYRTKRALDDITFSVHSGEIVGILGPNGAGKTTTMKILTCYLAPTSGLAKVGGYDVSEESIHVRRKIGYLPEDTPLYQEMTTLEFLEYVSSLRQIESKQRQIRIREIAEVCGLFDVIGQPVSELSKGYRQRVGLAQSLIHDPPILILDEPTSGLDPNQIVEIRQLIKSIGQEKTVILSTHILPEVQATCNRVVIIHEGKLVADGTTEELAQKNAGNTYRLIIAPSTVEESHESASKPNPLAQFKKQTTDKLSTIAGVAKVAEIESEEAAMGLLITAKDAQDLRRELFTCVRDEGWILLEMQHQSVSLEEIFRKLTRVD